MLRDRIEGKWINAFAEAFAMCKVTDGEVLAILSETQSRELNVQLFHNDSVSALIECLTNIIPISPRRPSTKQKRSDDSECSG
ncbi:MAG: hypothetical protein QF726_09305 [Alphaproteobacteria bacterium]|jgi:2,5-dihydroxypyridine 5,6-dioxygenase|nr:hypothetical protein [Alphaproteobacteria bacterium]|tara:strand:+ start:661 stop:909 length:249 start_codon:yes stop_codon:yes gene_type:complete